MPYSTLEFKSVTFDKDKKNKANRTALFLYHLPVVKFDKVSFFSDTILYHNGCKLFFLNNVECYEDFGICGKSDISYLSDVDNKKNHKSALLFDKSIFHKNLLIRHFDLFTFKDRADLVQSMISERNNAHYSKLKILFKIEMYSFLNSFLDRDFFHQCKIKTFNVENMHAGNITFNYCEIEQIEVDHKSSIEDLVFFKGKAPKKYDIEHNVINVKFNETELNDAIFLYHNHHNHSNSLQIIDSKISNSEIITCVHSVNIRNVKTKNTQLSLLSHHNNIEELKIISGSINIRGDGHQENTQCKINKLSGEDCTLSFDRLNFIEELSLKSLLTKSVEFTRCNFQNASVQITHSVFEKRFSLDTTNTNLKELNLRYCCFDGILAIDEKILQCLNKVIDLRDTKIANVPTLEALAPVNQSINFKKLLHKIYTKLKSSYSVNKQCINKYLETDLPKIFAAIKSFFLTTKQFISFDFIIILLLTISLFYLLEYIAINSVLEFSLTFKVVSHTSIVIILFLLCCLSLYVLSKGVKHYNQANDEYASKYCRLKALAHDCHDHALALKFTAAEHKAKRYGEFGFTATFLDYLMEWCCNYGQSIARPIACFIFVNAIALGYYDDTFSSHAELAEKYEAPLVFRNAVANLSGSKNLIREDMFKYMNDCSSPDASAHCSDTLVKTFDYSEQLNLDIVAGVQTFLSIFFIFLIGLGLRNRYKI